MTLDEDARDAALFDFICDFERDVELGRTQPMTAYLARYPGHAEAVAAEYLRLRQESDPAGQIAEPADERQLGHFRLLTELGRGGQGSVWLAEDTRIRRRVAVKLLGGLVTEERRARLKREAEAVSRLDHPGICAVHEADVSGEIPWLAMRYIEGLDLATDLAAAREGRPRQGPWLPRDRGERAGVLRFFERSARALHAAHEAGVVHRDVKPGNLRITPEGRPVLLDFGLARDVDPEEPALTMTGMVFGTPAYMSPEQVRGDPEIGPASDVFSLGATLYEALTGERPFQGENRLELMQALLTAPVPEAAAHNRLVNRDLQVVLETAMAKETGLRYASALDFAEDLRRLREYEPVLARPAGPALRLSRWVRREPVLATALLGGFLALTTGLVVALTLLKRVRHNYNLALGRLLTERVGELVDQSPAAALAVGLEALALNPGHRVRATLYAPLQASLLERLYDLPSTDRCLHMTLDESGESIAALCDDGYLYGFKRGSKSPPRRLGVLSGDSDSPRSGRVAAAPGGGWLVGLSDGDVVLAEPDLSAVRWRARGAGAVLWLEVAPDGKLAAVQRAGGATALVGLVDGALVGSLDNQDAAPGLARFSPGGERLVTSGVRDPRGGTSESSRAQLWSVATRKLVAELSGHRAPVTWSEFERSGSRLVTACAGGEARLWDAASGASLGAPLLHPGGLVRARFAPDGSRLATASSEFSEGGVRVWDLASGTARDLFGHNGAVQDVRFHPDGDKLVSCAFDTTVRVWDLTLGRQICEGRAYMRPVALHLCAGGREVLVDATGSRLHAFRTGPPLESYGFEMPGPIARVSFGADGEHALAELEDGTLALVHVPSPAHEAASVVGQVLATLRPRDAVPGSLPRPWPPGEYSHADTGSGVESGWLYRPGPGAAAFRLREPPAPAAGPACWIGDDYAWVCSPNELRIRTPSEADAPAEFAWEGRDGRDAHALALVPDPTGRELALVCADSNLRFVDAASGAESRPRMYSYGAVRAVWGRERLVVAGAAHGGLIRSLRIDGREGTEVQPEVTHRGPVSALCVDPTGRWVASGSLDTEVHVWVLETGELLTRYPLHRAPIRALAFDPRPGQARVLSVDAAGHAAIWPVDPGPPARTRRRRELYALERRAELGL